MIRTAMMVALLLAMSGCSYSKIAPTNLPNSPFDRGGAIVVRDFLVRGQGRIEDYNDKKAVGLVLLTRDNGSRNRQVCDAFVRLAAIQSASAHDAQRLAPTLWPALSMPVDPGNCDELLRIYDFDTAAILLQKAGRPSAKGPLVATAIDGKLAFIDLSRAKKKWIAGLVPAWAQAIQAQGGDIVPTGGLLHNICEAAGVNSDQVSIAVRDIVKGNSGPTFFETVRDLFGGTVVALATSTVPGADEVRRSFDATCRRT